MSERERDESPESRPVSRPGAAAPGRTPAVWARALAGRARRLPLWAWAAGVACVLLFAAPLLYFALRPAPGWAIVVRGAPAGSDVFVDNIRRGVTEADGTVRIAHLRTGNRQVKVTRAGYGEYVEMVSGADGDVEPVDATLASLAPAPAALPAEIDYAGPMVLVAAGEFVMGANNQEENERPEHRVNLPDFYIDKYEVTNAQYKKFCDEMNWKRPLNPWWMEQSLGTDDYFNAFPDSPVIGISWDDATAYAKWAGKRLPTEREWEKAASWGPGARDKQQWPWGNSFEPGRANVETTRPAPVTQFASGASAYGVFNMAGNVSEWVDSHYLPYEGNTGTGEIGDENYRASYGTNYRVTRGGTFTGNARTVRTSRRDAKSPDSQTRPDDAARNRSYLIGFRTAASADDPRLQKLLAGQGR